MDHRSALLCFVTALGFVTGLAAADPAQAQQVTTRPQTSNKANTPGEKSHKLETPAADPGSLENGVYRNAGFHFSYKLPFGWVDRTDSMQQSAEPGKDIVLLAVFERPPEASGQEVNSAVIIAGESVSSYPGLKTAADYFGPVTELTTGKGFKVDNEPYAVTIDAKALVRADFSKAMGSVTMHQSSLAMLKRGYILSFTFIAGSEDEIENLVSGLSFGASNLRGNPVKKQAPLQR